MIFAILGYTIDHSIFDSKEQQSFLFGSSEYNNNIQTK